MPPSTKDARPARSVPAYEEADEYLRPGTDDVTELDLRWINLGEGSRMKRRVKASS